MKSIVVSGPPAVGKTTVAKGLAGEFGLRYMSGGDVLKEMAREEGFDSAGDDWWDTEDGMRFLDMREKDPGFDRRLDERLAALFRAGGMSMTSYTLPWIAQGGIKVWLGGSHESSARRMQGRDNTSRAEAREVTKRRFDRNRELYRRLYGYEFGDLSVFDVIIDTDGLGAQEAIDAACRGVRGLL